MADVELDQVLVYDADTLKLLRKIGTPDTKHASTTPGDFARPTGAHAFKQEYYAIAVWVAAIEWSW